jgi:hypothetical protein
LHSSISELLDRNGLFDIGRMSASKYILYLVDEPLFANVLDWVFQWYQLTLKEIFFIILKVAQDAILKILRREFYFDRAIEIGLLFLKLS